MGGHVWRPRQSLDHEPGHHGRRLDAQKKSLIAQERDPWLRALFQVERTTIAVDDLVVVDESGTNLNMTPRMARAPRGQRAYGVVPRNTPPNTTLLASLTTQGIGPSLLIEGATDRAAFTLYVENVLAPSLRPGQIVLLDNLSVHKAPRVRAAIEARGCQLWFLPPYSPDFSPIELAFAKIKEAVRRVGARTKDALYDAVAAALETVTATDAAAFFAHCGYQHRPNWDQLLCSLL